MSSANGLSNGLERQLRQAQLELEDRLRAGENCRAETFFEACPALASRPGLALDLIYTEFAVREEIGPEPAREEFYQRFPQWQNELKSQFLVHDEFVKAATQTTWQSTNAQASPLANAVRGLSGTNHPTWLWAPRGRAALPLDGPVSADDNVPRGPLLGHYELLEKIGEGGMGSVFRARDRCLNRLVALKVIRPDVLDDLPPEKRAEWLECFRREVEAHAQNEHPHIVPLYEVGEIDDKPYFAMRYVEGHSLAQVLRDGPLANATAAAYLKTVACAVGYIHRRGLLHCDLNPKNILLDSNGQLLVTDFGLARRPEFAGDMVTTKTVHGTPPYMAPEQARQPATMSIASDVYSLGATLYHMLAGRPPFLTADPVETLRQVCEDEPIPPRRLNPAIDRDLELICLKCLRKEPDLRYSSADQLAGELDRYAEGRPLHHTRRFSTWDRLRRWCRRNPTLTAMSSLAATFLAAAITFLVLFAVNARINNSKLKRQLAENDLDRGQELCDKGKVGDGMLYLARSLRTAPAECADLQRTIRINLACWRRQLSAPVSRPWLHPTAIHSLAVSPDGRSILTGGADGIARLWLIDSDNVPLQFSAGTAAVKCVAFDPAGQVILTASMDGLVRTWNPATGAALRCFKVLETDIGAMAFSPDSRCIFMGNKDGTVRMWNTATQQELFQCRRNGCAVEALASGPAGRLILIGYRDGTFAVWDTQTREERFKDKAHRSEDGEYTIFSMAFSPDGASFLTVSADKTTRLWDVSTGQPIGEALELPEQVSAVTIGPDGKTALIGTDHHAQFWDLVTPRPLGVPLPHRGPIQALAFGPGGNTAVIAGKDGKVRIWETVSRDNLGLQLPHEKNSMVFGVAYRPDGKYVLTGSGWNKKNEWGGAARLWEVATGRLAHIFPHEGPVRAVAFGPRDMILTASHDGSACLWNATSGKKLRTVTHAKWILAAAFSPDGETFLTGSLDQTAQVWLTDTGQPVGESLQHGGGVYCVAYHPTNPNLVLTGGADRIARLWDVGAEKPIVKKRLQHDDAVWVVAFSHDGKMILTASTDKTAWLCETETENAPRRLVGHQGPINAAAFSPDGLSVITASSDETARLWDTSSGKETHSLVHESAVTAAAFSPNGELILTGSKDQTARLWDRATGKRIGPLLPNSGSFRSAVFCPQTGRKYLTGTWRRNAWLWSIPEPARNPADSMMLWTEVVTGLELNAGVVRALDASAWQARRQQLAEASAR
jgi:WD40 repeat protein/serine/threonine protein kinase